MKVPFEISCTRRSFPFFFGPPLWTRMRVSAKCSCEVRVNSRLPARRCYVGSLHAEKRVSVHFFFFSFFEAGDFEPFSASSGAVVLEPQPICCYNAYNNYLINSQVAPRTPRLNYAEFGRRVIISKTMISPTKPRVCVIGCGPAGIAQMCSFREVITSSK